MPSRISHPRVLAAASALVLVLVVTIAWSIAGPPADSGVDSTATPSGSYSQVASGSAGASATRTIEPSPTVSPSLGPTARPTYASGFQPLDLVAPDPSPAVGPSGSAGSSGNSGGPGGFPRFDPSRPTPVQSSEWLAFKAGGLVAIVDGQIAVLSATADPLTEPSSGKLLPAAYTLDVAWTGRIVEPPGYGTDEKGNRYSNLSYWNLCGPGSATVVLYYWQQLVGHPNVTGTAGYFLDLYAAAGVAWPSPGPTVAISSSGARLGTYWSARDTLSGYVADGRGFLMYMAMNVQPPGWLATGVDTFTSSDGGPMYPTRGASPRAIAVALNSEIAGPNVANWASTWYSYVTKGDPTLAADLHTAVQLDVGRDHVAVVAAADTYELPNWQAGTATPHTRHAISIVGYNDAASPPTYTYLDTCGRSCNGRAGNTNGGAHTIAQSAMVQALQDSAGIGFVW
jgi:hypothetical protein